MDLSEPARSVSRTLLRPLAASLALALLCAPLLAMPVAAQEGLTITTPYPSVRVQPGSTASFDLAVTADAAVRVDISVDGVPDGWTTTLRGGGHEVASVFASPDEPPALTLDVDVPDSASGGTQHLTVVGTAGGESVRLGIDVVVVPAGEGSVKLTTDVPARQATADDTFSYNVTLDNDTPQQLTFDLSAVGPRGWTVTVEPVGETDATSVTIDARGNKSLTVKATPPSQANEGQYQVQVQAVAGDQTASLDLVAAVTGRIAIEFTTADQRLNTTANAGATRALPIQVVNTGTAGLDGLTLTSTQPSDWTVTFDPATIDQLAPQGQAEATASITPSGNAVAGDYVVTLQVAGEGVNESIQIRVTVETPPIWGFVGIGLIIVTIVGLGWVFRRYGRR